MDINLITIASIEGVRQGQDEAEKLSAVANPTSTQGSQQGDDDTITFQQTFKVEQPSFMFVA